MPNVSRAHQSSDSTTSDYTIDSSKSQDSTKSDSSCGEQISLYHPQPEEPNKDEHTELKPYRVVIDQSKSEAIVLFRADVTDKQVLYLTLPQAEMSYVLRSFHIEDDRVDPSELTASEQPDDGFKKKCGARCQPTVHFPSPSPRKKGGPHRDAVWYSLLEAHIGKYAHLDTLRGPREGFILGLDVGEDLATIILDEDGKTGIHTFDPAYPMPISLHAPTSSVPAIVPHAVPHTSITAVIRTYGTGSGTVTASYAVPTPLPRGFDFTYRLTIPQSVERDVLVPNAQLQCSARIANPFHFDLNDVQLCLVVTGARIRLDDRVHEYDLKGNYPDNSQIDLSSPSRASSYVKSVQSDLNSDNDTDVLDTDMLSTSSDTDVTLHAEICRDRAVYEVSHPVAMPVGQSTEVCLFNSTVSVRICHYFCFGSNVSNYFSRVVEINNTSSMVLESGNVTVCSPDTDNRTSTLRSLQPGEHFPIGRTNRTPVTLSTEERINRVENSTSCVVRDGRLIIHMLLERILRLNIHNKQSHSVDICVEFKSRVHSGEPGTTKVARYATVEDSITCQNEQPFQSQRIDLRKWHGVTFPLEEGGKSVVVARELFSRDKVINLIDACSPRLVANLKAAAVISQPFAEKLKLISATRRKIERMRREQERFSATKRKLKSLAEAKISSYGEPCDNSKDNKPKDIESIEEHFATLEGLENDIASILEKSETLAEKLVDIEMEQKKLCDDLENVGMMDTNGNHSPDQ